MADNVTVDNGSESNYVVASDDDGTSQHQYVKLEFGADGTFTKVSSSNPLPISDASGSLTVDGTVTANAGTGPFPVSDNAGSLTVDAPVATPVFVRLSDGSSAISALPVTDNGSTLSVDDGSGSLTVDNAALSVTGGGVESTALRVTLANDSTGVLSVDDNGGSLTVDGSVTIGSALPAGTNNIGDVDIASIAAGDNNIGNVDVVTLPALPAGNSNIGDVDVASIAAGSNLVGRVQVDAQTGNGLSIFRSLDLDETEEEAKGTAGVVFGWYIANLATSTRFVKFYNDTAANVVVGTTAPVMTLPIPGNATDDVGANALGGHGIVFSTAITVAATTGLADNDTGAPGANEVVVNIFYK